MDKLMWNAEKRYYSSVVTGMVGRELFVRDAEGGEIGYTSAGKFIYIAKEHPLYQKMLSQEARQFRFGVAVHEALHQVFTNFDYDKERMQFLQSRGLFKKGSFEEDMYHTLVNLVEDPAIENMAPQVIGGPALKCLYFSVAKIDELCGDFNEGCTYPFEEVKNALIQFGDLGIIHGKFRFQTAESVFKKITPLFYQAINEPDNQKRIDLVLPIYEICSTLWEGYSEEKKKSLNSSISQNSRKASSSSMDGSGSGSNGTINPDSRKNQKRKATMQKAGVDENDTEKMSDEHSDTVSEDDMEQTETKTKQTKKSEDSSLNGNPNSSKGNEESSNLSNNNTSNGEKNEQEEIEELLSPDELPKLSEEELNKMIEALCQHLEIEKEKREEINEYYRDLPEYHEISSELNVDVPINNCYVSETFPEDSYLYDKLFDKIADDVSMMQEELRDLFVDDRIRKDYAISGKISMKRMASGRLTTRLFERRLRSAEKSNMCIGIIGDHSGSMSGSKLEQEKLAIIALSETFSCFNIPLYFMGFHSDNDVTQTHYIRWENSRFERERLLHMRAGNNNFDSYSIRYMTRLLLERPEKHKLLIVISDGLPSFYYSGKRGVQENIRAINEAKESRIDVLGIGIGSDIKQPNFLQMYGEDYFIHVKQPRDLFDHLANVITQMVSEW